jgi:putative ABC transport system permease protein
LRAVPLHDQLIGDTRYVLGVLQAAVIFVLLIACANAANLLLGRASARSKEFAIRVSVGAGRARVLRQLLVESAVLAALGSVAGLLFARAIVMAVQRTNPQAVPRLAEAAIDGRVLGVVLGIAVLTAFVFGLAPAFALWRVNPNSVLRDGVRGRPSSASSNHTRRLLICAELALALILLTGAGLMLKSVWRLHSYPPGFEPGRILTATIEFSGREYFEARRQVAFVDELLLRAQREPGVQAVSISSHGYLLTPVLDIEGEPRLTPEQVAGKPTIGINATTGAFARVMGLRIERGQWITDAKPVAVVNETLARREFRETDPIGRRIRLSDDGPLLTIVGVVADLKYSKLDAEPEAEVHVPYSQVGVFGFTMLARTTGDPTAVALALRRLVSEVDKTQVADDVMALDAALADSIAPRRLNLFVLATFATAALLLALIGIYGVMAYLVAQQTHEIGVRIALGAKRSDVLRMIIRKGMTVALAGIAAGLLGAFALTRAMAGLLYDVQPTDPLTFAAVTTALTATAFLACCLPALKAALVDPVIALRYE